MTSLHVAVWQGDEPVTQCLLEEGYDPNIFEEQLKTPLFCAVSLGIRSIVDLLLDHGACVELADNDGINALHAALCRDTPDLLELLLQHGGDCNYQDCNGLTLLDHAVENKKIEAARVLLKYDADPNMHDRNGLSPLFTCVDTQDIPFVKLLLENGADPNAIVGLKQEASVLPSESTTSTSDDNTNQPLVQNNTTCVTVSQSEEADVYHSAVSWAVLRGYEVLLELLLSKCDNITWKDQNNGDSVLHYAIRLGNDRILGILLKGGPDGLRNSTNGLGRTPLHIAAHLGDMTAASRLHSPGHFSKGILE
ncbi:hypothetical protein Hte_007681 [Hypoxylon texense]